MRTAFRISWVVGLICVFGSPVSAYSPFSNILDRAPDIAVTDIHQETRFVYMRVCNLGGSLTDSDTSLALAMKRTGGGVVSSVESVILGNGECHEFQIASVEDLGIYTSGVYEISAGAVLKDGRVEKSKNNNKIVRSIDITYPSKYSATLQSPYYYSNTNTSYYCNSSNNYCSSNNYLNNNTYYCPLNNSYSSTSYCPSNTYSNSTTYYCIPGTSNCSTIPYNNYNNNSYYCNSSNNYCANNYYNGSTTYYRSNICPPYDYACNNAYYSSTNTQYQNNNQYCTYSNNYCNNSNYNYNYNNNYNNQYDLPDLVVQRIYQNSGDKHIIAQICNQGGDMRNSVSLRTNFSSNTTATMYNTVQMNNGQCTSSVVYTTPEEMNIIYKGNASITVTVDSNNNLSERNESNNTLTQSLYVETNRNQRSDLTVDRIYSNDNNRTIVTRVCNVGDDILDYNNWMIEIVNTTINTSIRNSGSRLSKGQCTDMVTSYANLGIYRSGGYNFRATVDSENIIGEQVEWNNTMNQYLQLYGNYY